MATTIFQKRIYELDEFTPLTQGEPGWVDPATIWLGVDNVAWPEAMKISLLQFIADLHKEAGLFTLTGDETDFSDTFEIDMSSVNYYLKVDAWREFPRNGDTIRENIPIKNITKSVSGISLELEDYQAGDTIQYLAFEL